MGRLIDADYFKKMLREIDIDVTEANAMRKMIDLQPTAYDVNAVVKQLDRASDYYEFDEQGREHVQMVDFEEAVEIVKGGGING